MDTWIAEQVATYPKITTEELAKMCGKTAKTIKRHILKMPHIRFIGSGYSGHWEVGEKNLTMIEKLTKEPAEWYKRKQEKVL